MGNNDATQALKASLAADSATPNPTQTDRETYLQVQRLALQACIIEPIIVVAYADAWAQAHCGLSAAPYQMVAVAYHNTEVGQCLLYDPDTGLFSLAYGHIDDPDGLDLVGYSSTDALGQWLG